MTKELVNLFTYSAFSSLFTALPCLSTDCECLSIVYHDRSIIVRKRILFSSKDLPSAFKTPNAMIL